MAENVQQRQQQEAAAQKKESAIQETAALCKHCGVALDPDLSFCPGCGEKVDGGEYTCEFCQTKTSKEICPHCGRRVIPIPCPKCQTPGIYDACENCGAIMNPILEKALVQEAPAELAAMSAEEAKKIEDEFKALESNESAEFKAFQKKLIERQTLLEERDYFNKREKRIIKVFGSHPFTLELPDPAEEAFRMKAYAALEKTVIEREEKAIEAELDKLFPAPPVADTSAEDARLAEIERTRVEMEKKFNEALANVNNEVEDFRKEEERKRILEEERKRLEEERRRLEEERRRKEEEARREAERLREIERQRLEEERRRRRFQGNFYHTSHSGMLTAELRIGSSKAECWYHCTVCGRATVVYSVSINGDNITLTGGRKNGDYCSFQEYKLVENYSGTVNSSGTVLTGCWYNNGASLPIVFYKR
ncbi:hypothetical protein [Treponema sp. R8-4-B8]